MTTIYSSNFLIFQYLQILVADQNKQANIQTPKKTIIPLSSFTFTITQMLQTLITCDLKHLTGFHAVYSPDFLS